MNTLFALLLLLTAVFLILLVLVQRGRGGGLTGALGGMGGQRAFGTMAGDLFTRITVGVAFFWIVLSAIAGKVNSSGDNGFGNIGPQTSQSAAPVTTGAGAAPKAEDPASGSPLPATSTPAAESTPPATSTAPATSAPATSQPAE